MQPKTLETTYYRDQQDCHDRWDQMNRKPYYDQYIDQTKPHGITHETISPESQTCNHMTNSKAKRWNQTPKNNSHETILEI